MNSILLFSENEKICESIEQIKHSAVSADAVSLSVCSDIKEAESLLNIKNFFAVFLDMELLNEHQTAFLTRHNSYFIAIGKDVSVAACYCLNLSDYVSLENFSDYMNVFVQTLDKVLQIDGLADNGFKRFFMPDSMEKIILSSLLHEIRNNNNIVSLNAGMLKGLVKTFKDGDEVKNSEDILSYLERAIKGTEKTTEAAHMFGHIHKMHQTSMGSVSDFHESLSSVLSCFANRFKRLYSDVMVEDTFKMPYIKIDQRDMMKIILNMVYLAGLSLTDTMPVLKIDIFGDKDNSVFSLSFPEAVLYQGYFDNKEENKIMLSAEYLAALNVLAGLADSFGGSFSFKQGEGKTGKLEFCFSSTMFYS